MLLRERGINPTSKSLDQPIEFLTKIFESGVGYSSIATVRSAHKARKHIRQSQQVQLAGVSKSYLGKQELILISILQTQQISLHKKGRT